jgi:hypothetical protein
LAVRDKVVGHSNTRCGGNLETGSSSGFFCTLSGPAPIRLSAKHRRNMQGIDIYFSAGRLGMV